MPRQSLLNVIETKHSYSHRRGSLEELPSSSLRSQLVPRVNLPVQNFPHGVEGRDPRIKGWFKAPFCRSPFPLCQGWLRGHLDFQQEATNMLGKTQQPHTLGIYLYIPGCHSGLVRPGDVQQRSVQPSCCHCPPLDEPRKAFSIQLSCQILPPPSLFTVYSITDHLKKKKLNY